VEDYHAGHHLLADPGGGTKFAVMLRKGDQSSLSLPLTASIPASTTAPVTLTPVDTTAPVIEIAAPAVALATAQPWNNGNVAKTIENAKTLLSVRRMGKEKKWFGA